MTHVRNFVNVLNVMKKVLKTPLLEIALKTFLGVGQIPNFITDFFVGSPFKYSLHISENMDIIFQL